MYSAELLDHFEHPRNPGRVDRPDASATLENPACGDILELSLKISGGRILDARFRAKGCVPAMACGAALTELIKGKTIEQVRRLGREEIIKAVGGLPQTSIHASHLALDVLRAALQGRGTESGK
ncbi:MAG TPA: iron-sulfur cluster assembly scaffold protein [Terriglobales bacterium]|jgi:nitrogen fixation NifU-like protein|nr:iron-sulfur cluster assembly scaffold protein [Terriglobales bacterium]